MRVTCKSCGRTYDYHKEGTCPDCGAFNRLPRREKVNADGTVRHMTSEDFMEEGHGSHAGKVCFEEKVCYEEKECHESAARQVRRQVQEFRNARPAVMKNIRSKRQSTAAPKVLILIIIIIFFAIIGSVFSMIRSWNIDFEEHYGTSWEDIFTRDKEPVPPDEAWVCYYELGDVFYWNAHLITVNDWAWEGNQVTVEIECVGDPQGPDGVAFGKEDFGDMPVLQFLSEDDWVCTGCAECSVGVDMRTLQLGYYIEDEDVQICELVMNSCPPDDSWQEIHVELAS